ncbi:MAG: hypothetical protein Q4A66_00410 [Eubacteriales bacterium]|nr:hypothetical protein [Eubacteriales bacterium]
MIKKLCAGGALGLLCAAAALGLSALLVRSLGAVVLSLGGLIGRSAAEEFGAILGQLRGAQIVPAWPEALALSLAGGPGLAFVRRRWLRVLLAAALFVVLLTLCLWRMQVNGIRLGAMVSLLLPMLRAGAF